MGLITCVDRCADGPLIVFQVQSTTLHTLRNVIKAHNLATASLTLGPAVYVSGSCPVDPMSPIAFLCEEAFMDWFVRETVDAKIADWGRLTMDRQGFWVDLPRGPSATLCRLDAVMDLAAPYSVWAERAEDYQS